MQSVIILLDNRSKMLVKHRRHSSNFLMSCCEPEEASLPFLQISRDKKKTYKISLKQRKSTLKTTYQTINRININREEQVIYKTATMPKISFSFMSPTNKNNLRTSMFVQKKELSQFRSQQSFRTEASKVFLPFQSKTSFVTPEKFIPRNIDQYQQINPIEQNKIRQVQQDKQTFKTSKMKQSQSEFEETTINLERQKTQKQTEKQTEIQFQNSIVIDESSESSRSNSQEQKQKNFRNSQTIETAVRKWRKANTFTMSHQIFGRKDKDFHFNTNKQKTVKQDYQKEYLFEKVRKIDMHYSQAQEQSSSDRSEVIDDYKSLMNKIQVKEIEEDYEFIQI